MHPSVMNMHNIGWPHMTKHMVYVGRLKTTNEHYGNPFSHLHTPNTLYVRDRSTAIATYKQWLLNCPDTRVEPKRRTWILAQLKAGALLDKHLVCWCFPQACHADILLQLANP